MKTHPVSTAAGALVALAFLLAPVDAKPGGGNGNDKGGGGSEKGNKGGGNGKGNKGGGGGGPSNDAGKGKKDKDNKPDKGPKGDPGPGPQSKKDFKPDKGNKDKDFKFEEARRFRDDERGAVVRYFSGYKDNDRGLPPGLAKNLRRGKPLPPGWQDRYAPGYRIEDEYWDSFTPVPYDYFPDLRPEPGYALYYYGDRIVRIYEPRRTIIEVIIVPTLRF